MRFFTWLKEQTSRTDSVGVFAKWAVQNKLPLSSDPDILKVFVVHKAPDMYDAFGTSFIEYALDPRSQVPKSFQKTLGDIADKFFQ